VLFNAKVTNVAVISWRKQVQFDMMAMMSPLF